MSPDIHGVEWVITTSIHITQPTSALANPSHKGETARCCQKATLEQPGLRWFAHPQHPLRNTKYIRCLAKQISIELSQQSQPQISKDVAKRCNNANKTQTTANNPRFRTHETHPERMVRRVHSANDRVMAATCGRAWLPQWAS